MAPDLILLGQATIDHVVPAQPGAWRAQLGGNALYAAAGARLWLDPARIGVATRRGRGFPWDLGRLLENAGIGHRAIVEVEAEHLIEWILFEEDGNRRSLPRNVDLRRAGGEGSGASEAYLARLEALSPSVADLPAAWLSARAAHLAPQVADRHRAAVAALGPRVSFLSVDPSPHYSAALSAEEIGGLLAGATALLPSEQEVGHLIGPDGDGAKAAADLRAAGFTEVVIKRGKVGALVAWAAEQPVQIPALTIEARDPTGAGDSFCGAYAACRLLEMTPPEAARRATIAAAMVVACAGAEAALALAPEAAARRLGDAA